MMKLSKPSAVTLGVSLVFGVVGGFALLATTTQAVDALEASGAIIPQPVPPAYGIPGNREALQAIADANDTAAIRHHAWKIWEALTADSKSSYQGQVLPIWETWLATADVFTTPPTEIPTSGKVAERVLAQSKPSRSFVAPHQFAHRNELLGLQKDTNASKLVGFNKFDPSMVSYAWSGHQGPADGSNKPPYYYTSYTSQWSLNLAWPGDTPLEERKVVDAPSSAFELKPVLQWVAAKQLTAIPLWEGPNASTAPGCNNVSVEKLRHPTGMRTPTNCHPDPSTWTHCVLIDAAKPNAPLRKATAAEFASADTSQSKSCLAANADYAGIDTLYHFELTAVEAAEYDQAQGGHAKAGDSAVLVAMHVNTKEISDWTWQTFWWHAGLATPNNYPGGASGRPDSLPAPWNNYDMCAVYSQTTEPNNQGNMHVCFNPFLETSPGIPDGLRSNCVSCHGTAAINAPPTGGYPISYYKPIEFDDPQYFACATQIDFSYALLGNPTNQPKTAPSWVSGCPNVHQ